MELLYGMATIKGSDQVQVSRAEEVKMYKSKHILIATGSEAMHFPGLKVDEKNIVTSTGALSFEQVPERLVIIGGGIIGLELVRPWSKKDIYAILSRDLSGTDLARM